MNKDKIIDLLFAKNGSLKNYISQIQTTIERQREKSMELMDVLRFLLQHMEEQAIVAGRCVDIAMKSRMVADGPYRRNNRYVNCE